MDAPIDIPSNTIASHEIFTNPIFLKEISTLGGFEKNIINMYANAGVNGIKNFGDPTNEYSLNSFGYRTGEFRKVPVVFAGCSVTFGVGVPEEGIWSSLVGEKLGLDYINLSAPGWSTPRIVDNLFKYFYEFGNPEMLFVVLPDYHRLVLTSHRDFCVVGYHHKSDHLLKVNDAQLGWTPVVDRNTYSKKPYTFIDFITPEQALFETFRSINSLITYCKGSNIKLVWSTWDSETHQIIDIVKNGWNKESYSGYVYSKFTYNGEKNQAVYKDYLGCHSEHVSEYGDSFFRGQDLGVGGETTHPGVHYHMHLAEEMLKGLEGLK
jgi:hypothetical protein